MKKITVSILSAMLMLSMVFSSSVFAAEKTTSAWDSFLGLFGGATAAADDTQVDGVTYQTHIQNEGWAQGWVSDGAMSGSEGKSLRLEGLEVKIDNTKLPADLGITYQTQIENEGWAQGWVSDGEMSGSSGKGLRLEAVQIKLTGASAGDYSVGYKTHIQNKGWETDWSYNGDTSGTVGEGLRLEAIEIEIFKNIPDLTAYNAALAAVKQADYTATSWAAYQAVVASNVVTEDNLVSEVDAATANIVAAQANLQLIPKVTSVTVINARQVQIAFNTAVDKDTAQDTDNYAVSVGGSITGAVLSDDAKSVVLTLATAVANKTAGIVTVNADAVATVADTDAYVEYYSSSIIFNDTVAPKLLSVTSTTNSETADTVVLTFSEPISSSTIKIDGTVVAKAWTVNNTVATVTGLTLDATTSHVALVTNATDYASPANVAGTLSDTFTIKTDAVAPTVAISAYSDKAVLLTFDKAMATSDATALTAASDIEANLAIVDEALASLDTAFTVAPLANDTTYTKYVVTLSNAVATNLYANKTSRTITLVFTDDVIADTLGNTLVGVNKAVTLTKDTTAPTITSITAKYLTTGYNKSITVTSSKAFTTYDTDLITVVDSNGVLTPFASLFNTAGTLSDDSKSITFAATGITTAGEYSFTLAKGFITDESVAGNLSKAYSQTVNLGTSTTVSTFDVTAATAAPTADRANVITVTYDEQVKGGAIDGSATDVDNYNLNGSALPDGSTITLDAGQTIATITIPAESIDTSDAAAALYITNVKSLDGTMVVAPTTIDTLNIYDNVSPVLKSAALTSYDAAGTTAVFTLTFSENMNQATVTAAAGELIFKNGSTTALAYTDAEVTAVPGYPKQLTVTVTGITLNTAKALTLTTGDIASNEIVDAGTVIVNPLTADTVVSVSK